MSSEHYPLGTMCVPEYFDKVCGVVDLLGSRRKIMSSGHLLPRVCCVVEPLSISGTLMVQVILCALWTLCV